MPVGACSYYWEKEVFQKEQLSMRMGAKSFPQNFS